MESTLIRMYSKMSPPPRYPRPPHIINLLPAKAFHRMPNDKSFIGQKPTDSEYLAPEQ